MEKCGHAVLSSGKENPVTKIMESATRLSSIQKEVKDYFLSKEFNEKVSEFTNDENVISEAEKIWKDAEKMALNRESVKNIDNIFEKLKTYKVTEGYKEIELKLEEFKAEYREGAWNGLIS